MTLPIVIAGLFLLLGGLVQGALGFGLALVSVPVITLVEPTLVPAPLLLVTGIHSVLTMIREREHVDWPGVGWATLGRLPGTVVGVVVVDSLPQRGFAIVVGSAVLTFTLLSVVTWHPRPTPPALATAGLFSGAFGTAMAVGGPPLVLLYQHEKGARIRSTLAAYFILGTVISAVSLAIAGHLHPHDAVSAALLAPFLVVGFALSGPARRLVDGGRIRVAVLCFVALSALALIGRSLIG